MSAVRASAREPSSSSYGVPRARRVSRRMSIDLLPCIDVRSCSVDALFSAITADEGIHGISGVLAQPAAARRACRGQATAAALARLSDALAKDLEVVPAPDDPPLRRRHDARAGSTVADDVDVGGALLGCGRQRRSCCAAPAAAAPPGTADVAPHRGGCGRRRSCTAAAAPTAAAVPIGGGCRRRSCTSGTHAAAPAGAGCGAGDDDGRRRRTCTGASAVTVGGAGASLRGSCLHRRGSSDVAGRRGSTGVEPADCAVGAVAIVTAPAAARDPAAAYGAWRLLPKHRLRERVPPVNDPPNLSVGGPRMPSSLFGSEHEARSYTARRPPGGAAGDSEDLGVLGSGHSSPGQSPAMARGSPDRSPAMARVDSLARSGSYSGCTPSASPTPARSRDAWRAKASEIRSRADLLSPSLRSGSTSPIERRPDDAMRRAMRRRVSEIQINAAFEGNMYAGRSKRFTEIAAEVGALLLAERVTTPQVSSGAFVRFLQITSAHSADFETRAHPLRSSRRDATSQNRCARCSSETRRLPDLNPARARSAPLPPCPRCRSAWRRRPRRARFPLAHRFGCQRMRGACARTVVSRRSSASLLSSSSLGSSTVGGSGRTTRRLTRWPALPTRWGAGGPTSLSIMPACYPPPTCGSRRPVRLRASTRLTMGAMSLRRCAQRCSSRRRQPSYASTARCADRCTCTHAD